MKDFVVSVPSQKKLNTYGVESPCEYSPGVGEERANPGLSKEQLVPSCTMSAFIMEDTLIETLAPFTIYLSVCRHQFYYKMHVSTP